MGDIIVVKGQNLDISPESSNGSGKSTICCEIMVYGLYGKLVKNLPRKMEDSGVVASTVVI